MNCYLVSNAHWDCEWYLTFESFRLHMVDRIDHLLELLKEDPGYCFLLEGQTIILEDYLEIRPKRRACRLLRVRSPGHRAWYVQPDSFLPVDETHVCNLLEGRLAGGVFVPVSGVAYTPDSFGQPAQFPLVRL